MPRITLTLDEHTVEALAARIDDATRSLEDVASQVLYEAARQVDEEVGYRAPCKCGWLEKFADEPDIPIHFDTQTN